MKATWSKFGVLILCLCISLYGIVSNAGMQNGADVTEMVICSGGGPVTVFISGDGNPVLPPSDCCDCLTCNAPITAMASPSFQMTAAPAHLGKPVILINDQIPRPLCNTRPQARGPPSTKQLKGACAITGCGSVCKDTAA